MTDNGAIIPPARAGMTATVTPPGYDHRCDACRAAVLTLTISDQSAPGGLAVNGDEVCALRRTPIDTTDHRPWYRYTIGYADGLGTVVDYGAVGPISPGPYGHTVDVVQIHQLEDHWVRDCDHPALPPRSSGPRAAGLEAVEVVDDWGHTRWADPAYPGSLYDAGEGLWTCLCWDGERDDPATPADGEEPGHHTGPVLVFHPDNNGRPTYTIEECLHEAVGTAFRRVGQSAAEDPTTFIQPGGEFVSIPRVRPVVQWWSDFYARQADEAAEKVAAAGMPRTVTLYGGGLDGGLLVRQFMAGANVIPDRLEELARFGFNEVDDPVLEAGQ